MNPPDPIPSRPQILVVEGSSVFSEMQGLLLRQAGYGVGLFENPHAALDAAVRQRFDFALIDYELPNVKSEQFMHALRTLQPGIAIGFVSSFLTPELIARLSRHRVAGIFSKPANPKLLLEKIAQALNHEQQNPTVTCPPSGTDKIAAGDSPRGFDSIAVWAASAAPFPTVGVARRFASETGSAVHDAPQRSGTNPPMLATKSLFRPASKNYNFGKRLAESIAVVDAHRGS